VEVNIEKRSEYWLVNKARGGELVIAGQKVFIFAEN
jgi:hypothetical protein